MENQITLSKISRIFDNYEENGTGADTIKLTFNESNESLTVHIRCADDCMPYYSWAGEYPCTLKNLTQLLIWMNNYEYTNDYGEPYHTIIEWDQN